MSRVHAGKHEAEPARLLPAYGATPAEVLLMCVVGAAIGLAGGLVATVALDWGDPATVVPLAMATGAVIGGVVTLAWWDDIPKDQR